MTTTEPQDHPDHQRDHRPLPDASTLADAVHTGRRSAADIAREHLARVDRLDPTLNAFQEVRPAGALAEASLVDVDPQRSRLPLAGVPVVVKDNTAVAGLAVRHGSAATSHAPATEDDLLVRRLRTAGCVVLGSTRMPELAAWAFTSSAAFGVTRNPADPDRDPGGSSGGAAAAVASGMAALAVGTDGGGSLRVPAAACGLVGVKPTRGLVPLPGGRDTHWFGLTVAGPLARTPYDAAVLLAVLAGRDVPHSLDEPPSCRVGSSLRSPSPLGRPDAHQRAALAVAEQGLAMAGHTVRRAGPAYPVSLLNEWGAAWLAGIAEEADRLGLDESRLEPRTRTMVRKGRKVIRKGGPSAGDRWRTRALAWFEDHDVLLTPVTARVPAPAGALDGRGYLATYLSSARSVPFCQAWNLAGFPAVTVPVGSRAGLPMAVQLVGPPDSEGLLLGLAGQLFVRA